MTASNVPRSFVIQEHFVRTRHFDLRLEKDGVFRSWVLRRPVPRAPGVRRLAIQVDDHDLGLGGFEGESPGGKYGAGRVRIWDRGTYMASRWDEGRISFRLSGRWLCPGPFPPRPQGALVAREAQAVSTRRPSARPDAVAAIDGPMGAVATAARSIDRRTILRRIQRLSEKPAG